MCHWLCIKSWTAFTIGKVYSENARGVLIDDSNSHSGARPCHEAVWTDTFVEVFTQANYYCRCCRGSCDGFTLNKYYPVINEQIQDDRRFWRRTDWHLYESRTSGLFERVGAVPVTGQRTLPRQPRIRNPVWIKTTMISMEKPDGSEEDFDDA